METLLIKKSLINLKQDSRMKITLLKWKLDKALVIVIIFLNSVYLCARLSVHAFVGARLSARFCPAR